MRTIAIAITLALTVFTLNTRAQDAGGSQVSPSPGSSPGAGPGQGQKGEHHRPNPEQMAAHLMEKFDANKDGELSQDELTKALESLRERKSHGPGGGGGGQGGGSGGPSQGGQGGPGQGAAPGGRQGAEQGGAGGGHQGPPPADKAAAHMIEKFSSDKKGLTQAELTKALEEHHAHRGQQGGGHAGGPGGGGPGGPSADKPSGPPPSEGANQ